MTNVSPPSAHTASGALRLIAWAVLIPGLALWVPAAVFVWLFGASPTQCAFFGVLAVCAPLVALSEVRASPAVSWSVLLHQASPATAMVGCLAMMGLAGVLLFPEYPAAGPHEYLLSSMPALSVLAGLVALASNAASPRRLLCHGVLGGLMLWGSYYGKSVPVRESMPLTAYPIWRSQYSELDMDLYYVKATLDPAQQAEYVKRLGLTPVDLKEYEFVSLPRPSHAPEWWHSMQPDRAFSRDERALREDGLPSPGCETLVAIKGDVALVAKECFWR